MSKTQYTPKQGQYLAFIYHYTKVNGRPPAQTDMRRYFQVSPPVVHQMILNLEAKGLLARTPTEPRSLRVLLRSAELPELASPLATMPQRVKARQRLATSPPANKQRRGKREQPLGIDQLSGEEAARVLHALLERRPDLRNEAQELAESLLADVSVEDVADEVEAAVDLLDLDDLHSRAGRTRDGYVEPSQAAWDLVEEMVMPFIHDIQRRAEGGQIEAALNTCVGVVLGLYRLRDRDNDEFLGWAVDAPDEMVGEAVVTLRKALRKSKTTEIAGQPSDVLPTRCVRPHQSGSRCSSGAGAARTEARLLRQYRFPRLQWLELARGRRPAVTTPAPAAAVGRSSVAAAGDRRFPVPLLPLRSDLHVPVARAPGAEGGEEGLARRDRELPHVGEVVDDHLRQEVAEGDFAQIAVHAPLLQVRRRQASHALEVRGAEALEGRKRRERVRRRVAGLDLPALGIDARHGLAAEDQLHAGPEADHLDVGEVREDLALRPGLVVRLPVQRLA